MPFKVKDPAGEIVAYWYARVERAQDLGPPKSLYVVKMSLETFAGFVLSGSIVYYPDRKTAAFKHLVNSDNFPGVAITLDDVEGQRGEEMLRLGQSFLRGPGEMSVEETRNVRPRLP